MSATRTCEHGHEYVVQTSGDVGNCPWCRLDRAGRDLERLQKGVNEEHDRAQSLSSRLGDALELVREIAEYRVIPRDWQARATQVLAVENQKPETDRGMASDIAAMIEDPGRGRPK